MMSSTDAVSAEAAPFEAEAKCVLGGLRDVLADLIAAVPPGNISTASDLHRALRIDMKLGWKIFKVAQATDPTAVGHHVPGPNAMKRFLEAAARRQVPTLRIEAVSRAVEDFERLVTTHADDRATFDSMISAYEANEDIDQINLAHKRAAFRAQSHIWGVQVKTILKCLIIQPADDPNMIDMGLVSGFLTLRPLRHDVPLVVSRRRHSEDDGSSHRPVIEPLDRSTETKQGIALLREFCSKPIPELRAVEAEGGYLHDEVIGIGVGNKAAVTCVSGSVIRRVHHRYYSKDNRAAWLAINIYLPSEVLVYDLLIREDTCGAIKPRVTVYGDNFGTMALPKDRDRDKLALRESVVHLGRGPAILHTPEVPRYTEMTSHVFDRLGWDADRFDAYRYRIGYPVMPSTVVIEFELPSKPDNAGANQQ